MPSKLSDGVYIAVDVNGEICVGANSSGIKLYVYEKVAIRKAGLGGKVYRVTETGITHVWPVARTFFLNEQHEEASLCRCGKSRLLHVHGGT